MLNHANISAKRAKEAAAMLRSGKSKVHALKHYQGTLQKEEAKQVDEAVPYTFGNKPDRDNVYKVHRQMYGVGEFKHHEGDVYHSLEDAKVVASNMKKNGHKIKITKHDRPSLAGPRGKLPESVEQVDEARRMSAAEKLGRAFDSEQQRSALSRQRGLDLLKQKDTEKMQNKPASGNMTKLKKEETEESTMKYIEEKLTAADPASKWISDFVKSDNPKFAGKSKKERIQQALGAYYAKKRGTNEEVEQVDEVNRNKTKTDDYGGRYLDSINRDKEIKELERKISKMSPNDHGGRYLAGLELDKLKAMKEEAEQVVEQDDSMEKKEMAQTQLHFIKYAAEEILGFIKMGGEIEEWYQNKLSKVQSEVESLHSYIEGEKRRTGMVEEAEQVNELRASTYASASNKRQAQAGTAAKVGANHASRVLQDKSDKLAYSAAMTGQREFLKTLSPATKRVMSKEEAEGKVAVTPKEKSLAAHHGDPKKITYGDVIKARLKSAAAKKMGK
jgi:hypothetical protein